MDLTAEQMDAFMVEAIAEAYRGESEGEVPIGAVIVLGSGEAARVVAAGHNRVNALGRRNAHAEIVAFEASNGNIPLDAQEIALISTLEPCVMCFGAAIESGFPLVVYGCPAPLDSGTGRVKPPSSPESRMPRIVGDVRRVECEALFREWLDRQNRPEGDPQVAFVRGTLAAIDAQGNAAGDAQGKTR